MVRYLKQAAPQPRQDNRDLIDRVREMIADIEQNGDNAVRRYAAKLDGWSNPEFRVSQDEIAEARKSLSETFKEAFR